MNVKNLSLSLVVLCFLGFIISCVNLWNIHHQVSEIQSLKFDNQVLTQENKLISNQNNKFVLVLKNHNLLNATK